MTERQTFVRTGIEGAVAAVREAGGGRGVHVEEPIERPATRHCTYDR
jgi:hypothetical protein